MAAACVVACVVVAAAWVAVDAVVWVAVDAVAGAEGLEEADGARGMCDVSSMPGLDVVGRNRED